jgi:hypothetical protein
MKKTSLEPLRQGQRLDTSETKLCSSKERKPPKHTRAPPCTYACSPWISANPGHKPIRPVPKTGQTGSTAGQAGYQNRSDRFDTADHTNQKPKMQKKCTSSPLTFRICSKDAMQLFSTFLPTPCCQCMNQGSKFGNMKPRASQIYKIHHKTLHMSKWAS